MPANKSFGSKLSITVGSTLAEIGQITNLSGPSYEKETIDVTHMGSAGGFREFLGGLKDAGEISCDVLLDPVTADTSKHKAALTSLEGTDIPVPCELACGTVAKFTFNAIVTGFSVELPLEDGKQTASISLKISGKPTLADIS
jgi:predicted secreted protein